MAKHAFYVASSKGRSSESINVCSFWALVAWWAHSAVYSCLPFCPLGLSRVESYRSSTRARQRTSQPAPWGPQPTEDSSNAMYCKNPYLTRIWVCHQVKHADSLSKVTQFPFMNHNTGLVLADWTAVMLATVYCKDATSVQATPLLFYTKADTPLSWLRAGWAAILIKPRDGDN